MTKYDIFKLEYAILSFNSVNIIHIIILHKFWTAHKNISNYLKLPGVSNILMRFVIYGIKLI